MDVIQQRFPYFRKKLAFPWVAGLLLYKADPIIVKVQVFKSQGGNIS